MDRGLIVFDILRSLVTGINNLSLALFKNADAVSANTEAQRESTKKKERTAPLSGPVAVTLNEPIAVTVQGNTTTQVRNSWDWRDWLKLGVELAGFLILVWYSNTTWHLLKESRAQTVAQINASRMDQRAWLKVTGGNAVWNTATPMRVPIQIENFGKTQALHVFAYVVPNLLRAGQMPSFKYDHGFPREVMRIGVLSPMNTEFRDDADILPTSNDPSKPFLFTPRIPTLADLNDLAQGRTVITISGQVWYDDVFGVHHWLKYCHASPVNNETAMNMIDCSDYNSVDGEQEYPNTSKPFIPPPAIPPSAAR